MNTATADTIKTAALTRAAARCDVVLKAFAKLNPGPSARARVCRETIDEFSVNGVGHAHRLARIEHVVLDLFGDVDQTVFASRDDLLAAVALYCDTGASEVRRILMAA